MLDWANFRKGTRFAPDACDCIVFAQLRAQHAGWSGAICNFDGLIALVACGISEWRQRRNKRSGLEKSRQTARVYT